MTKYEKTLAVLKSLLMQDRFNVPDYIELSRYADVADNLPITFIRLEKHLKNGTKLVKGDLSNLQRVLKAVYRKRYEEERKIHLGRLLLLDKGKQSTDAFLKAEYSVCFIQAHNLIHMENIFSKFRAQLPKCFPEDKWKDYQETFLNYCDRMKEVASEWKDIFDSFNELKNLT